MVTMDLFGKKEGIPPDIPSQTTNQDPTHQHTSTTTDDTGQKTHGQHTDNQNPAASDVSKHIDTESDQSSDGTNEKISENVSAGHHRSGLAGLKVSSNFDKPDKNKQTNQKDPNPNIPNPNKKISNPTETHHIQQKTQTNQHQNQQLQKTQLNIPSKPSFSAVVHSNLAADLKDKAPVDIKQGTHLGKPEVFFNAQDYFINLAQECKLTVIGKFSKGKPTMEEIRRDFVRRYHLKGPVKIAYFDHRWDVMSRIVESVGTAIAPDQATYSKTNGNVAKLKVEIDLLKPKQDQIWLGFNKLEGSEDGMWLDIEYDGVPSYCKCCLLQGHMEDQSRVKKERDDKKLNGENANKGGGTQSEEMVQDKSSNVRREVGEPSNSKDSNQWEQPKKKKRSRNKNQVDNPQVHKHNKGIVIQEPDHQHHLTRAPEVPGKGKMVDESVEHQENKTKKKVVTQKENQTKQHTQENAENNQDQMHQKVNKIKGNKGGQKDNTGNQKQQNPKYNNELDNYTRTRGGAQHQELFHDCAQDNEDSQHEN
ncbi:PREDICTED: uncharacterized protein LOC109237715 [Nicotiana attenuata]|uniref:DUF4283 domain-containing protein n=1 Tax=Nicotiana attenuata TaxID=49451 RepID=A0A314LDK0_NICAT|nr:PREDICTED: uncharacterized protein LOC109237715 [Nicotiana attenuata]OIT39728.1 hypothetical protein A4A49_07921 [Nicotiana attenuata]